MDPRQYDDARAELEAWAAERIEHGFQLPEMREVASYLVSIKSTDELQTYLLGLFGDSTESRAFASELQQRKDRLAAMLAPPSGVIVHQKQRDEPKLHRAPQSSREHHRPMVAPTARTVQYVRSSAAAGKTAADKASATGDSSLSMMLKQRTGNADVTTQRFDPNLPGRKACSCQARDHNLLTNCIGCGRIICDKEGLGPCFTCGVLPETKDGRRIKAKQVASLSPVDAEALARANERKNRLLEYDRSKAKRTVVIDDQVDYYSHRSNRWLSQQERSHLDQLAEQRDERMNHRKRSTRIIVDVAGRRVETISGYSQPEAPSAADEAIDDAFRYGTSSSSSEPARVASSSSAAAAAVSTSGDGSGDGDTLTIHSNLSYAIALSYVPTSWAARAATAGKASNAAGKGKRSGRPAVGDLPVPVTSVPRLQDDVFADIVDTDQLDEP